MGPGRAECNPAPADGASLTVTAAPPKVGELNQALSVALDIVVTRPTCPVFGCGREIAPIKRFIFNGLVVARGLLK